MKKAYLKGYFWYKNFWDELLFFWVVNRIFSQYPELENLIIEVGNKVWMEYWVKKNYQTYISSEREQKIIFTEIKQHRWKRLTHVLNLLWFWKYSTYFKFFWGWEVLTDERNFPHDGRNIPLLFGKTIRKWNFMLLGGIGTPQKRRTKFLYTLLLPRAKAIITREETSYKTALKRNKHTIVYQDFSQDIIKNIAIDKNSQSISYVLINCNPKSRNTKAKQDIIAFCKTHAQHKKIFFPGDIREDMVCFWNLQQDIPDLEIYDWTKYSLQESLNLFQNATAAIWARLHFLLPLKIYNKDYKAIKYAEKIHKMID